MRASYLVIATSARSLIASARRGSIRVQAFDCFADADSLPEVVGSVSGDLDGFEAEELLPAVDAYLCRSTVAGIVVGSGFEQQPALLDALATRAPLLGNHGAIVSELKSPIGLQDIVTQLGFNTPAVQTEGLCPAGRWLLKRIGGCGGQHVRRASVGERCPSGHYFQMQVDGQSGSALFLANGVDGQLLGVSGHWQVQVLEEPDFRHAGLATSTVEPGCRQTLQRLVAGLTKSAGLRGLNGVDFIRRADGALLVIEVNPRPTASIDLFDATPPFLFSRHVQACHGDSLRLQPPAVSGRASAVVYSPARWRVPGDVSWPLWITDRPRPGAEIGAGEPFCTLHAHADTAAMACHMVRERLTQLESTTGLHFRPAYDHENHVL